jgi:oligopeptide transport system substrate-binding protein
VLWKKAIFYSLILILTAILSAGCGGAKDGTKQPAKLLRIAIGAEPETLDPRKSTGFPESYVENQIFEGLAARDHNGNAIPGIAETWDIAADGLKYTFHLRANAKWSNGDPVTAHDFEYAWKTTLSPELASKYADQLYYLKNGESYNKRKGASADQVGVKAINDRTLEVTLERPTAYFLSLMAFHTYYPVHKKTAEANANWAKDPKTLIVNGPFTVASWVHNSKIELTRHGNYWDKANVKSEKLELILSDSNTTIMSMFENNQLDMADYPPPVAETPRLIKEGKLKIYPYLGTYYFAMNVNKAPFDHPKVRQAFALAINRKAIVENITRAGEKPAMAWVPFGLPGAKAGEDYRKAGGDFFKDNDVETAKRLLTEAGYPEGKGLPPVTILYNTNEQNKAISEAIQEMWKKNLGAVVNLTNQEWKVYLASRKQGDFQVARSGWVGDYVDAMTFADVMISGNGNNVSKWTHPRYDELIRQAQSTIDQSVRMKAIQEAEKLLMEEMPIIPIYFYVSRVLEKPNVKGVIRGVDGGVYLKGVYLQ